MSAGEEGRQAENANFSNMTREPMAAQHPWNVFLRLQSLSNYVLLVTYLGCGLQSQV